MFKNEISSETRIDGTAAEVWAVLSDFAQYPAWNPGMQRVEGHAEVGSRLSIAFTLNGGRTMKMRPTVLVADPGHELRWLGRLLLPGVFDGEHRFEIHEDEPGRVRFVQSERFRGVLVPFLRKLIEVDTATTFGRGERGARRASIRAACPERVVNSPLGASGPPGADRRRRSEPPGGGGTGGAHHAERGGALGDPGALALQARREQGSAGGAADRRGIAGTGRGHARGRRRAARADDRGASPLAALAAAYRTWALAHPHLYRLATEGPLPRASLPDGLEAWTAAPLVLAAGSEDRARATWAFAHGMAILELDGRFPPGADLGEAWMAGIAALS